MGIYRHGKERIQIKKVINISTLLVLLLITARRCAKVIRHHFDGFFFPKYRREVDGMAKTQTSVRGVQHKKIVPVKGYIKSDGTRVGAHRRSTPK